MALITRSGVIWQFLAIFCSGVYAEGDGALLCYFAKKRNVDGLNGLSGLRWPQHHNTVS